MYSNYANYVTGYASVANSARTTVIAAFIIALVAAILLFIFVLPAKKRENLNGFLKGVSDFFNFKFIIIESILKFLHAFLIIFVFILGLVTLFQQPLAGLLIMILGPILIRIGYEFLMLTIILVQNSSDINRKLKWPEGTDKKDQRFSKPDLTEYRTNATNNQTAQRFCSECGAKFDPLNGGCTNPDCPTKH